MKKILIVTSYLTGVGHKSIADSVTAVLDENKDIEYRIIEGFELGGPVGVMMGKSHVPALRINENLWRYTYEFADKHISVINGFEKMMIEKRFSEVLDSFEPDIVVTIHSLFNESLSNIIEKKGKKIPLVVLCADLVTISRTWCNTKADMNICPTPEAARAFFDNGIPEEKIKVIKLPVKKETVQLSEKIRDIDEEEISSKKKLTFLVMSGSEGARNYREVFDTILRLEESEIRFIAGNNKKLKEKVEKEYAGYSDRVKVYGFVDNVGEIMLSCDIAIVRGSPNVLMECISCLLPVIVNGAVPGQEQGNIDFVLQNGFGINLTDQKDLSGAIDFLVGNGKKEMIDIKKRELRYRDADSSKKICSALESMLESVTENS